MLRIGVFQNEQRRNGIAGPAQFAARLGIVQRAGEHHRMQIGGRIFWQGGKALGHGLGKGRRSRQHASPGARVLRAAAGKQEHDAGGCGTCLAALHEGRGFGGQRHSQIIPPPRRNRHTVGKRPPPSPQGKGNIGGIGAVRA